MKANEAPDFPEKVYIPRDPEYPQSPNIWWERESSESNIEYIRKDTFIEKAYAWLKNHYRDYMHNPTGKRLEAFFGGDMCNDFEDYMKGE